MYILSLWQVATSLTGDDFFKIISPRKPAYWSLLNDAGGLGEAGRPVWSLGDRGKWQEEERGREEITKPCLHMLGDNRLYRITLVPRISQCLAALQP